MGAGAAWFDFVVEVAFLATRCKTADDLIMATNGATAPERCTDHDALVGQGGAATALQGRW